jgi:hypothetical protein
MFSNLAAQDNDEAHTKQLFKLAIKERVVII